jgi:hypothetical protein
MFTTFECPSCGAPLQYSGGPTQYCTYCQNTVFVPQQQQPQVLPFQQQQFQVNAVYQQKAVVDLRPYTRNAKGGLSRGFKWGITLFVLFIVITTLAPVLMALLGVLLSVVMTILEL